MTRAERQLDWGLSATRKGDDVWAWSWVALVWTRRGGGRWVVARSPSRALRRHGDA